MSTTDHHAEPSHSGDCPPCAEAPVLERIDAHRAVIGEGFVLRRALPTAARRMVGPWCFLDHLGPAEYAAGNGLAVGPHPHIGLQTFTWLVEGEIFHRDSLGTEQIIRPGQVNLMTAGRGIAHSEDTVTPDAGRVHAAQLWIALPDAERHRAPSFHHYATLPQVEDGGFVATVLAGESMGLRAPAEVFSPIVGVDYCALGAAQRSAPLEPTFEHAVLVMSGEVTVEGETVAPGTLLYLGRGRRSVALRTAEAARLLLVGGAPFGEEVLMWWNFVGRTHEEILAAAEDWNAGRAFAPVVGSPSPRIPAPDVGGLRLRASRGRR
ncbi:MAG: pirin family protein [Myxococcales bacterium]|nr:pirin family protein [Myxococcales bacterium]